MAPMKRRGFTLIEVLVTMAIIGVLVAILSSRGAVGTRRGAADKLPQ